MMSVEHAEERKPLPLVPVTACPVCGSQESTPLFDTIPVDMRFISSIPVHFQKQVFSFIRCTHCSLAYLKELPANADLEVYYGSAYGNYYKVSMFFDLAHKIYDSIYSRRFKYYLKKSGRTTDCGITILDYGCGTASRINNLQQQNTTWKCFACDNYIERVKPEIAPTIHLLKCNYTQLSSQMEPESCDIITAFHVIEHMDDPVALLHAFNPLLKSKGIIFLEFPVSDGWEATLFSSACLSYHAPCHFTMPTKQSILCMAGKTGYSVLQYGNEIRSGADLGMELEWRIRQTMKIPKAIFDVLRLPLAAALLPVELIQSLRGKNLSTQYAVLQKR